MPTETLAERDEVEGLRQAIAHYKASPGPVIPHRFFGPLSKAEWDRLQPHPLCPSLELRDSAMKNSDHARPRSPLK